MQISANDNKKNHNMTKWIHMFHFLSFEIGNISPNNSEKLIQKLCLYSNTKNGVYCILNFVLSVILWAEALKVIT